MHQMLPISQKLVDKKGRTHAPLRPTAVFWLQFILRCIGFIISLTSIAIGVLVVLKIRKTWAFVFVSTILASLVDLAEFIALAVRHSDTVFVSRIHPFVLIPLDALTIGLLVWSFFSLIFDKWGKLQAMTMVNYPADPFNEIEMWFAVTIGVSHAVLLFFDFVDCWSRRKITKKTSNENLPLPMRRPTATSYSGNQVNAAESVEGLWGTVDETAS